MPASREPNDNDGPAGAAPEPRPVRQVAILTHPRIAETAQVAADLAMRLRSMGVTAETGVQIDPAWRLGEADGPDCLVVLGGDGSIVRAGRAVAGLGVPILGVNLGQLGFLAELQPAELPERLPALVAGRFRVEQRVLLRATLAAGGERHTFDALNDVVVARAQKVRAVAITVTIDGEPFATYRADGVIVATPTGSTAYAMAAGGPILAPELANLVLIPVAPHLVPARALVAPASSTIRLQADSEQRAVLSVDGQEDASLGDDDVAEVALSPRRLGMVRFGPPADFYGTLFRRLRWATARN